MMLSSTHHKSIIMSNLLQVSTRKYHRDEKVLSYVLNMLGYNKIYASEWEGLPVGDMYNVCGVSPTMYSKIQRQGHHGSVYASI